MDETRSPAEAPAPKRALPLFALLAVLVFVVDQTTKQAVSALLAPGESAPAEGILRLTLVSNTGSAFGILQGQTAFLVLASFIGIFGVLFYYRANGRHSLALRTALGFVLGGALGNLTDRLVRGAVVDFVDVQFWPGYHWPTFNVADSALMVGLVLLALYVLRQRDRGETPSSPAPSAGATEDV